VNSKSQIHQVTQHSYFRHSPLIAKKEFQGDYSSDTFNRLSLTPDATHLKPLERQEPDPLE